MEPLRRAFRGYDTAQVDALLADLRTRQETLHREVDQLREQNARFGSEAAQVESARQALASEESAVKEALISAHRQAEDVLAEARREAEILLQVARETGARMQEDLRGRIDDLNWQIERLSLQRQRFQADFRGLLEGYLGSLSEPEQPRLLLEATREAGSAAVSIPSNDPSETAT